MVTEVARSLEFSPAILAMADRVVAAISKSATSYNAVHLRIEKDARDWSQIMGGPEVRRSCLKGCNCLCAGSSSSSTLHRLLMKLC